MDRAILVTYLMRALVMLVAIPVHEASHALVSARLGDTTAKDCGRLTLNPAAHFDLGGALCMVFAGGGWAKPVGVDPRRFKNPKVGMAVSAAAGPLSNFILALCSMVAYKLLVYLAPVTLPWRLVSMFFSYMVSVNIALGVFNLLPVPPFDGSRIITVFLPQKWYFRIMRYERYLFAAVFLLLVLGALDAPLAALQRWAWNMMVYATGFVEAALRAALG